MYKIYCLYLTLLIEEESIGGLMNFPGLHLSNIRCGISRRGRPFSNTLAAALSWQHDFRSATAKPEFAERRGK